MIILLTTILYFILLLVISRVTGRGGNDAFFRGNRQSPWGLVAFGMVGASLSGVTFVSVPGMVMNIDMTYIQMCIGFLFGYVIVAFVLLPLYYRYNLTTIYTYLDMRFGSKSYTTGALFFMLSKMTGAAARLYLVCLILQHYVFDDLGVPYVVTVVSTLVLMWLYTRRGGIKTLVWTDALQTLFLLTTLVLIIVKASDMLGVNVVDAMKMALDNEHGRMFEMTDFESRQNFFKQFFSGLFVVIVMTGLDQDMMQKNLTCKDLRSAQKDMITSGFIFIPVNFLFLILGVMLLMLYQQNGMALPEGGDRLMPDFVASGVMGESVLVIFTIGIISSAFSSADSAMTALTTCFCIDILKIERREPSTLRFSSETIRKIVHVCMMLTFVLFILAFKAVGSQNIIDAIYMLAGYTYGPLLGLFAFGITTYMKPRDKFVPIVAVISPLICLGIDYVSFNYYGYSFGYEMLIINGALTYGGLCLLSIRSHSSEI